MDIDSLDLAEPALSAAKKLKKAFPGIVFTSGRRAIGDQARAMAQNLVQDRTYLRIYKARKEADELQAWLNAHPSATTQSTIEAGLLSVMKTWPPARLGNISKHLSGLAFDVQPMPNGTAANAVKAAIRALPGCTFLEREAGLTRWHAQFR